jgi:hypothetical protein
MLGGRAAAAACSGLEAVDTLAVIVVLVSVPSVPWPVLLALPASALRAGFIARAIRSAMIV